MSHATAAPILSAPIEVGGDWGGAEHADVIAVLDRARSACLSDVTLVSDRQPERLLIEDRNDGGKTPPSIWLHTDKPDTAWIIVDVGALDWSRLAYQFGHELGHVLANSWQLGSESRTPCQWVEEMLVESFCLRGLKALAESWAQAPPFPDDARFGQTIRDYRDRQLEQYRGPRGRARPVGERWFAENRAGLEAQAGLAGPATEAVPTLVEAFEQAPALIGDLGALNRWPQRTGADLSDYLGLWEQSCRQLGTEGALPARIRAMVGL
ncbi:hypothetical protein U8607_17535 [Methylobacterium durans]|uniref:hypothetical protein n=1 Tax=Methylobacterium durans TaxID=2202825 RepID=UPI002AFF29AD|nr:hypothetical protein [Methylobacterium durans]MEA1833892.1 hypothetical protein [Methylobacterium durans]